MKISRIFLYSALSAVTLLTGACDDDDNGYSYGDPKAVVSTPVAPVINATSADVEATFDMAADFRSSGAGFCYDVNPGPTIYGNAVKATVIDNKMTATLTGLAPSTTYYIRAYVAVYDNSDLEYSPEFTITTGEGTPEEMLENYVAPKDNDYYVAIAGWSARDQWNLANVHDPSVVKAADGYYYMYQTDASYGNVHIEGGGHFHGRRSKDLVNWEYLGATMPELPEWVVPKLNEIRKAMGLEEANPDVNAFGYWAPVVRKVSDNLYRMYYSIVCPGSINGEGTWAERAFIGLMENTNPADNSGWVDKGYVITNASDRGLDFNVAADDWANCYYKFNAIDPAYIITDAGEHWLVYGSWNSGIAAVKVDAESGKPANLGNPWGTDADIASYGKLIYTRQMGNRWQASEGPEIIYHDGYYYLFLAYDALGVPYNTRVVRSKNITGPYLGIDGTDCTNAGGDAYPIVTHPYKFNGHYGWGGISHCAVFDDGEGNWFYASQGRLPVGIQGNEASNALMTGHVRSIRWTKSGWPVVMPERYGAVPQVAIAEEELIGNWENIDLGYQYETMKESVGITLNEDHTVTGGQWDGAAWSYDAEARILTVGSVELYLMRECDWEAAPRTHTIVYAGIDNRTTFWGKKLR